MKRKTNEEFIDEIKLSNSNIILLSPYINNRTSVTVKCCICNYEWKTSPKSLLRGSSCPICARKQVSLKSAKTHEDFVREIYDSNSQIRIIGEYKNSKTPIIVECKKCGYKWNSTPNSLLKIKGCPICTGNIAVFKGVNDLKTTNQELCKEWCFDKNDPLKPDEVRGGSTKKVWWKCKYGHIWQASIASRNKGSGCPICAKNIKKTTKQFIDEIASYNPHIEVISEYQTAHKPVKVRCLICGNEWSSKPNSLLRGTGCTNCVKKQTSFMEQFLLIAFRRILSEEAVISRDKDTIGMELDIYIPSLRLALEPGSWIYHKEKTDRSDTEKRRRCSQQNIRLITVYDTYPKNQDPPYEQDCYIFNGYLNEYGFSRIIKLTKDIMNEYGISSDSINWSSVSDEAYLACHYNADESFKRELSIKFPNIEVLEQYKGSNIPILVRNKTCGHQPWKARPYSLMCGTGCPECAKKQAIKNRTRTQEEFANELSEIAPHIKVIGQYTKINERVEVECLECGHRWNPLAYSLTQGKGCPHCSAIEGAKKRKGTLAVKTTEEFIKEIQECNSNIEICGEYINNKTKIDARCKTCGYEWRVVPASLLNGHGCPKCARRVPRMF